jgi:hypothetical protein
MDQRVGFVPMALSAQDRFDGGRFGLLFRGWFGGEIN